MRGRMRCVAGLIFAVCCGSALAAPDTFSFIERSNVATATFVTSEAKTLSGVTGSLAVSVSGGNNPQYRIDSGAFTSAPGSVGNGQTVTVRHLSAASPTTASITTVTVGDYSTPFKSTTSSSDRTPDAYSFGAQGNVPPGTLIESASIVPTGFNTAIAIVTGPGAEYRINNDNYSSANGSLLPGQTLTLRHLSSAQKLDYTKTALKLGGVVGAFTTRTEGELNQAAYPLPPPTQFTLSVTVNLGGSVISNPAGISCGSDCSKAFAAGSQVMLNAVAAPGYLFSNWSGVCSQASGACTVTMNQTKTAGAIFVPLPKFKVAAVEVPSPLMEDVCIAGYSTFCARHTATAKDPLLATAIAFSSTADEGFIIVKTTNIGFFAAYKNGAWGIYDLRRKAAERIKALGLPPIASDHIFVVSDHSHQSPDTIGIWGGVPDAFMQRHADRAADAAVQAWAARVPANLYVGVTQGPPTKSSYNRPPTNHPDAQFRLLYANDIRGHRIATLVNYAPHATVTGSDNQLATGDWTAWAPQEISLLYGGVGMGTVGALGAMDWNKSGNNAQKEAEARQRLRKMMNDATLASVPVNGGQVKVEQVFIHEPVTGPALYANYARLPVNTGMNLSIERKEIPPWLSGAVMGTYAGAARIGDVFFSAFPGEPFPELHYALRDCASTPAGADCGGVRGTQANFLLGAANDFLGYMLYTDEQYQQVTQEGTLYLGGCPEEQLYKGLGQDYDGACPDHWTLMVSPTIGRHIVCTVQDAADRMGFTTGPRGSQCAALTASDGRAGPTEGVP